MKTPSVKLQPSPRRLWPYLLMVSLCGLIAWGLRENIQPSSAADSATAVRSAPVITAPSAHTPTNAVAENKECACSQCTKPDPSTVAVINEVPRANRPVVEDLLRRFRQSDRTITPSSFESLKTREIGKRVSLTAAGIEWNGTLDSRMDGPEVMHFGITLDDQLGRFQISLREDQRMQSAVLFNGENVALVAKGLPEKGSWKFETSTYDEVVCAPAGALYTSSSGGLAAAESLKTPDTGSNTVTGPLTALPLLNSKPSSTFVLYMDFDGEIVTHPGWNNGKTIDAKADPRAENAAYVTNVWKRVAEDFAPFDLNVTTDRAVFDAAAVSNRVMCVSTPTNTAAPGAGGVAYLNSFGQDTPCWNFNISLEYASADTVSHEVGHTLGLTHDGTDKEAYYGGHGGTGPYSWSPIMGAAWANDNYEEVTQFSKGEYPKANNKQDDLTIITTDNGFGYQADDKGNSRADATPLKAENGKVTDSGIIERTNDADWLSFTTSGGSVLLNFKVTDVESSESPQDGSNLAIAAELYDSAGALILTANDPDSLSATISTTLTAGTYFVKLDGVSKGTLATGFPEYGSLGQYAISGNFPQVNLISISPVSASFNSRSNLGSFTVTSQKDWTWSANESWVTSKEAPGQNGNQKFDYSVAPNTTSDVRTAQISLTVPGQTVIHTITQEARGADDHGNFTSDSTLVGQNSITDGELEVEGDHDVFQIKVTRFGNLTVETSGLTNTFGEILSYQGVVLGSNDNALLPNFRITRAVTPGTYYVRVRHALARGIGVYKMIARIDSNESLSISPQSREVGAGAAGHDFSVVCNTAWTWTSDAAWLTSTKAPSQIFGQKFAYNVTANTTSSSRTGRITLKAGALTVVHTVVQVGALADDHGNTNALATAMQPTGSLPGKIDAEGDVDVFSIVLPTSGDLKVWTTGTTDTYGYLYDANGTEIAHNDDLDGTNFGILYRATAGTYYVKVRHFSARGTGSYTFNSYLTQSQYISVTYSASAGGSITGMLRQSVLTGGDARVVTAVPKTGYAFVRWSDGHALPARDDRNLQSHLTVMAEFSPMLSVSIVGGEALRDNQFPKVDFGERWINEIVAISFEIRNNGSTPLTQLNVLKSGINMSEWSLSSLPLTTLQPGQSTILTATLQGISHGYKSALFTLTATGTGVMPFRIPVAAKILNNVVIEGSADLTASSLDPSGIATQEIVRQAPPAIIAAPPAVAPDTAVIVSPDGWLRHQFLLAHNRPVIPEFYISHDGIDWVLAEQLSVRKTDQLANWDKYEVILSPMGIDATLLLVSENPPAPVQR